MSTLRNGDKGASVLLLQGVLHKLNYAITDVDGVFGGETERALKDFQESLELSADGVLGENTANTLISELWASDMSFSEEEEEEEGTEVSGEWEDA